MRATKPGRPGGSSFGVIGLAMLVIFGGAAALRFGPGAPPASAPPIGGAFDLVDGYGQRVRQSDLAGRFALIYFGYTGCPDICPTTLGQIAIAMDRLGQAARRVQPVFITVDPARDTPGIMARYTASISPDLLGLTGSAEAIGAAERAFHVQVMPANGGFDHSSVIYMIGPDGRLVAPIPADAAGPAIAAEILRHLS
jgi:protein SCO1/2